MLKIIPRILQTKNFKSRVSFFSSSTTAPNPSQPFSFQDNFDLHFDHQIFKQDSLLEKNEQISKKDLNELLSLPEDLSNQSHNLNKLRDLLHNFLSGYGQMNETRRNLQKISINLQKASLRVLQEKAVYDHSIIKLLFMLCKDNVLPLNNLVGTIHEIANNPDLLERFTLENLTNLLLILSDIVKLPSFRSSMSESFREIIQLLEKRTEVLLQNTHPHEYEFSFCLPKILFCFVQFEIKDKKFLNRLLSSIMYCDFSKFEEMEITSLLYSVIKMEKKLHILTEETKSSFNQGFQELYTQLIEIIVKRIDTNLLSYTRVPYIMYCFAMVGSYSKVAVEGLMKLFLKNIERYNINEVCTIMYCMWRLPDIDYQNKYILSIINLYFENSKENLRLLFNINLYTAFLGIRRPIKSDLEPNQKEKVENFLKKLLSVFQEKFMMLTDESKIRILYEVTHIHKMIERKEFLEKYTPFLFQLDISSLNNHDIITIGYLMKKYFAFNEKHFNFWNRYLECLSNRNWNNKLEDNRIQLIFTNIKDLLMKNTAPGEKNVSLREKWIQNVNNYYKIYVSKKRSNR